MLRKRLLAAAVAAVLVAPAFAQDAGSAGAADNGKFALGEIIVTAAKPQGAGVGTATLSSEAMVQFARTSLDDAVKFVATFANVGRRASFLVEHDRAPIGMASLDWADDSDAPELGYCFGVDHWGKGFATEMATRLLGCVAEDDTVLEKDGVTLLVDYGHVASSNTGTFAAGKPIIDLLMGRISLG